MSCKSSISPHHRGYYCSGLRGQVQYRPSPSTGLVKTTPPEPKDQPQSASANSFESCSLWNGLLAGDAKHLRPSFPASRLHVRMSALWGAFLGSRGDLMWDGTQSGGPGWGQACRVGDIRDSRALAVASWAPGTRSNWCGVYALRFWQDPLKHCAPTI